MADRRRRDAGSASPRQIWTIGHSSRSAKEFLDLLLRNGIRCLVDIRRFPGSRTHPQFSQSSLAENLQEEGIAYHHLVGLGGRRKGRLPDSPNHAWRVESFNAFADYMLQPDFEESLAELVSLAEDRPTVMMCSEAVPWRCHRRLISDVLTLRGWEVLEIIGTQPPREHQLTPFGSPRGKHVVYPGLFPTEAE